MALRGTAGILVTGAVPLGLGTYHGPSGGVAHAHFTSSMVVLTQAADIVTNITPVPTTGQIWPRSSAA